MNESRSNFLKQFVVTPTVHAIILKFLSGTNLTLKVDRFDGFVNLSSTADFLITKTSRCNFYKIFWKRRLYQHG